VRGLGRLGLDDLSKWQQQNDLEGTNDLGAQMN